MQKYEITVSNFNSNFNFLKFNNFSNTSNTASVNQPVKIKFEYKQNFYETFLNSDSNPPFIKGTGLMPSKNLFSINVDDEQFIEIDKLPYKIDYEFDKETFVSKINIKGGNFKNKNSNKKFQYPFLDG